MDYEEYTRHVMARASTAFHGEMVSKETIFSILNNFIRAGNELDSLKKSLMYGRPFSRLGPPINPYGFKPDQRDQEIIHAILGFSTEGVELVEALLSFLIAGRPFDKVNLQEEFGDGEWYRALGLQALGQTNEQNLLQNDAKLEKRYGPVDAGFTYKAANERDLNGERATLESNK